MVKDENKITELGIDWVDVFNDGSNGRCCLKKCDIGAW